MGNQKELGSKNLRVRRKYLDEAYVFGEVGDDLVESFSTKIQVRACQDLREAVRCVRCEYGQTNICLV